MGIKLITLLEQIHSIGYVYNDLKPDNICIGNYEDENTLHQLKLIDFGLATSYLVPNSQNEHIKQNFKPF